MACVVCIHVYPHTTPLYTHTYYTALYHTIQDAILHYTTLLYHTHVQYITVQYEQTHGHNLSQPEYRELTFHSDA